MLANCARQAPNFERRFSRLLRRHKQRCCRKFGRKGCNRLAARHFIEPIDRNAERTFPQHSAKKPTVLEGKAAFGKNAEDAGDGPGGTAFFFKRRFEKAPRLDGHQHITIAPEDRKGGAFRSAKMSLAQM